jgi:hypothetical protein
VRFGGSAGDSELRSLREQWETAHSAVDR